MHLEGGRGTAPTDSCLCFVRTLFAGDGLSFAGHLSAVRPDPPEHRLDNAARQIQLAAASYQHCVSWDLIGSC